MTKKRSESGFVVCLSNEGYRASLIVRRIYPSLPDAEAATRGLRRVVDESGEDYLFPAALFASIELPRSLEEALTLGG